MITPARPRRCAAGGGVAQVFNGELSSLYVRQRRKVPHCPVSTNGNRKLISPNVCEMVGPNGLEPSTSSVSRKRSNQLSYGPIRLGIVPNGAAARFILLRHSPAWQTR